MYLHPVLIRDLSEETRAEQIRLATRRGGRRMRGWTLAPRAGPKGVGFLRRPSLVRA